MKAMKIIREFIALTAVFLGMTTWAGDSAPFLLDTIEPLVEAGEEVLFSYNSSWIGGDPSAEVVISVDGEEVKRATGEGDFAWSPTSLGKHTLTYTTYIDGVQQDEVYEASVYVDWKYAVEDGNAVLQDFVSTDGVLDIPSEIDGHPVVGFEEGLFVGRDELRNVTLPAKFLVTEEEVLPPVEWKLSPNGWILISGQEGEYMSPMIGHNGSTTMSLSLMGPYELSFEWLVSSENNCDFLRWSLDGSEKATISGTGRDWQTVTYSIPEGKHTVTWLYTKDGSVSNGDDCGWVRIATPQDDEKVYSHHNMSGLFPDSYKLLESVTVLGTMNSIHEGLFAGCERLTRVTLPNDVTRLALGAFDGCNALVEIDLPNTLVDWGLDSLPPLMRAEFEKYDSNGFCIVDGWLLGYDDREASELIIPDGVIGIGSYALAHMYDLERVSLPQSLKYISEGAFAGDSYLDNLVIPENVETIGPGAFMDCSYLQTLSPLAKVKTVGERAFAGCTQLAGVSFGEGLETIGVAAFDGCWRMQSVELPLSTKDIAPSAFTGCESLMGVTVPTHSGKMTEWFAPVYSQIQDVTVPDGELEVRADMFAGCSGIESVSLPKGITNIAARAFKDCESLTDITLPPTCLALGEEAFANAYSLKSMVLPESIERIGAMVFSGCSSLSTLTLSHGLEEIPDRAFAGCSSLDSFVVPASVKTLGPRFVPYRTTAIYYLGDAPSCAENVYADTRSSLVSYVVKDTKGWDGRPNSRDIPQSWNGRDITTWEANRFDVTFDAAGGMFPQGDATTYACEQVTDTAYALPPFEPVRDGYVFDGYWTAQTGGTRITSSTSVTLTKAHILYARWTANEPITVRFNANGGTVSLASGEYGAGVPYWTLPVPTREHYNFTGWFTRASGGMRVTEASEVPSADHELFAHWTACRYVIRYNNGGGAGAMSDQSFTYGDTVTLRRNTFEKENYSFAGWAIVEGGAAVYSDCKTLTEITALQDGVINLYAVWSVNRYSIRFDSNDGTGQMANETLTMGMKENLFKCLFSRSGYVFLGWGLSPSGGVVYKDGETVYNLTTEPNQTVVLYAIWQQITIAPPHISVDGVRITSGSTTFVGDSCIVKLETPIVGAEIFYSTTGSAPRPTDKFKYTQPFTVSDTTKVIAFARQDGVNGATETVTITKRNLTLAEAAGDASLVFETGGNAAWIQILDSTSGNGFSVQSGKIWDNESTWIKTTVTGPGTLTFKWKVDCEYDYISNESTWDHLKVVVDDGEVARIDGTIAWMSKRITFDTVGPHTIMWEFSKDDYNEEEFTDLAWLSEIKWTAGAVSDITVNVGDDKNIVVPASWIDKYDSIVTAAGGDKAAALQRTAANGRKVWECFMLGVDPMKADDDFKITRFWIEGGKPMFEFSHSTDGAGNSFTPRLKVKGKAKLSDGWSDVPEGGNSAFRFFTVEVALP